MATLFINSVYKIAIKQYFCFQNVLNDEDGASLSSFKNFVAKYNKVYESDAEFNNRFQIFQNNMRRAQELNKSQKGTAKYGATIFADLSGQLVQLFNVQLLMFNYFSSYICYIDWSVKCFGCL